MKGNLGMIPVIFLVSGTVLTIAGLAVMVARGDASPMAAGVILAVGLLDGITGLVWTAGALFSRRSREESPGAGASGRAAESLLEIERRIALASGLLAVIFLGTILACLLYLHVIVNCLRSWRIL